MSVPVPLRGDFEAGQLRGLAKKTKDGPQARRFLALAAIYDGATGIPNDPLDNVYHHGISAIAPIFARERRWQNNHHYLVRWREGLNKENCYD